MPVCTVWIPLAVPHLHLGGVKQLGIQWPRTRLTCCGFFISRCLNPTGIYIQSWKKKSWNVPLTEIIPMLAIEITLGTKRCLTEGRWPTIWCHIIVHPYQTMLGICPGFLYIWLGSTLHWGRGRYLSPKSGSVYLE